MNYPIELEFTETEERVMGLKVEFISPREEIEDTLEFLEINHKIKDFRDMLHLKNIFINLVNENPAHATTIVDDLSFEEKVALGVKIENRKKYRKKPKGWDIKWIEGEGHRINLMINGMYLENVDFSYDMDDVRPYIVIDHTVVYLDDLEKI